MTVGYSYVGLQVLTVDMDTNIIECVCGWVCVCVGGLRGSSIGNYFSLESRTAFLPSSQLLPENCFRFPWDSLVRDQIASNTNICIGITRHSEITTVSQGRVYLIKYT